MPETELVTLRRYSQAEGLRLFHLLKKGFSDADIAESLAVSVELVTHWVETCRLAQFRAERTPEQEASIAAHRAEQRKEWVEHVAVESAALSSDGFTLIREKLDKGDARGMNDAARAVSTLVQMARQADGMDSEAKRSGGDTFNLYIARIGEAGIEDARPVLDITPKPEGVELI